MIVMKKFLSIILSALIVAASVPTAVTAFAADKSEASAGAETSMVMTAEETTPETTNPVTEPETQPSTQPVTEPEPVLTPATPKTFESPNRTISRIALKWNACANATKYLIFRSDEKADGSYTEFKRIATVTGKTTTTYTDRNLTNGTIYKYRLYAYRTKNGITTHSGCKGLRVMTLPKAVNTLKINSRSFTSITIEWEKNPLATEYVIYRSVEKKDGSFSKFVLYKTIAGNYRGYKNGNLDSAKVYKYRVAVRRTVGKLTGDSSVKATSAMTSPAPTKSFKVKKSTTNSISIAWAKIGRADYYQLFRKDGGKFKKIADNLTTQKYTDKGLSSGMNYTYRVRGVRKYNGKKYAGEFASVTGGTRSANLGSLSSKSYLKHALLSWNYVSSASGYDIFVTNSKGALKKIGTTAYRNFLTNKYTAGKTYTFTVKPYYYSGGSKVFVGAMSKAVTIVSGAYGHAEPTGTWVEVCTEAQVLKMYVNGKGYISTPVVTGNYGSSDTTPGYHTVFQRASPTRLAGSSGGHSWDVPVQYWLGFTGDGQGIHDSTWRTSGYGGEIYKGDGSNGCVNTPYDAVAKIYAKSYMGMPVIVF